jgi:hypothetical protein
VPVFSSCPINTWPTTLTWRFASRTETYLLSEVSPCMAGELIVLLLGKSKRSSRTAHVFTPPGWPQCHSGGPPPIASSALLMALIL